MNILVLSAARENGKTQALTMEAVNSIKLHLPGVTVKSLYLSEMQLPLCDGCGACLSSSEANCPHYAAVSLITDAIFWADGILFASPVYAGMISSSMKNLLEHLFFMTHRPMLHGYHIFTLCVGASTGARETAKYLKGIFGSYGADTVTCASIADKGIGSEIMPKTMERVNASAQDFADIVSMGPKHPSMRQLRNYNKLRADIQIDNSDSYDSLWWEEEKMNDYPWVPGLPCARPALIYGQFVYSRHKIAIRLSNAFLRMEKQKRFKTAEKSQTAGGTPRRRKGKR
ncbi:MAG: NAD(P)H-dependent oxidoreductase [Eubacteriales bacterium]|nr:NAD(P)H-dependent oxidoreductase [Eubacteriales bacterium]MDD3881528.1 NAD(P)H-dependent oxidoreductase [Eubacteriales bacterium]MDD4512990.1 NAD(P)H-dependent oxidoreductase [Eubacteriales bacterium]